MYALREKCPGTCSYVKSDWLREKCPGKVSVDVPSYLYVLEYIF